MNKFRFALFLLIGLVCAVHLSSCNQEPDLNFKETQTIINSYLYDNYETGDTLLFVRDSCITDTFIVTHNVFTTYIHRSLKKHQIATDTLYASCLLRLTNKNLAIEVAILQDNKSARGRVELFKNQLRNDTIESQFISSLHLPLEFTITNSLGHSAHLRKGEGVVDFSDGEHTWVLKNNNDSIKQPYFE